MTVRVLFADDDVDFLDVTSYGLRRAGFSVSAVSNGREALDRWHESEHDIVLLDVNTPELQGIDACRAIRTSSNVPIVLISGSKREVDMIQGFQAGADDYVTKPISIQHLVLRLRALHKRVSGRKADLTPHRITLGPLVVDRDSYSLEVEGKPVKLTRIEFLLLFCLAANAGNVVPTARLIDYAWGLDGEGDMSLLKTHFSHIRRKIGDVSAAPVSISALPGAGYSLKVGA